MIKEFMIKNFKCFGEIAIKPLERVNLIAGANGIVKTALLEAMFLHEGAHNAGLALNIERFRGIASFNNTDFMKDLFTRFKSQEEILLKATYEDKKHLTLKVIQEESTKPKPVDTENTAELQGTTTISPRLIFEGRDNGAVLCRSELFLGIDRQGLLRAFSSLAKQQLRPPAIFVSTGLSKQEKNKSIADNFSIQVGIKRKKKIIDSLRLIDNRLQDLELSKMGNENFISGDIGYNKMIPLSLMGAGVERYLEFVLSILAAENGTILIDEIENGFHHSIHDKIWSNLASLARELSVQIIATTHSYECIEAAHKSFKQDKKYDFILHRLDKAGDRIEDVTYDKDTLEAALTSNMEIR